MKQTMSLLPLSSAPSLLTSRSESIILTRLSVPRGCHADVCKRAFLSLRGKISRCFGWLVGRSFDRDDLKVRCSYAFLRSVTAYRGVAEWTAYQSLVASS